VVARHHAPKRRVVAPGRGDGRVAAGWIERHDSLADSLIVGVEAGAWWDEISDWRFQKGGVDRWRGRLLGWGDEVPQGGSSATIRSRTR
jgi:hypothetical protein